MSKEREALAEQPAQQQEPVAWVNQANLNSAAIQRNRGGQGDTHTWSETPTWNHSVPLYTSPPPRKPWVGLTQQDINIAFDDTQEGGGFDDFARAIEAKLRERNEHWEKNAQPSKSRSDVKPLTDEQITAGARALCKRMAESCGVDERDEWQLYADTFKEDAKAVLEAAAKHWEKNA